MVSNWGRYEFADANLRIDRARKHLTQLEQLVETIGHTEPNPATDEFYDIGSDAQLLGQLDSSAIQIVAGDFFHNIRSTLNYITMGIWRFDSPDITIPYYFQFPIESSSKQFSSNWSILLKGISDKHIAMAVSAVLRMSLGKVARPSFQHGETPEPKSAPALRS
jgi:hypothetical protein